jgi:hypothetical protein
MRDEKEGASESRELPITVPSTIPVVDKVVDEGLNEGWRCELAAFEFEPCDD